MGRKRIVNWIIIAVAGAAAVVFLLLSLRRWSPHWSIIQGAVIRRDADSRKESPIAGVVITATHGTAGLSTKTDASGYFKITFPETVLPGQTVGLTFEHSDYHTLRIQVPVPFRSSLHRLVIAAMTPVSSQAYPVTTSTASVVSNIKVRYTVNSQTDENIGSAVKTFQVINRGNIPCDRHFPCSPDGYWKASTGSVQLDAGPGNEFREARASCIAGPCPFTRIDSSGFTGGGRVINASATDWSDTATFLLEAEVFHTENVSNVRQSYPVVFGRALNFTLPPTAEGVCLEAELDGAPMVFPLGPDLYLSWATCEARTNSGTDKSAVYQCVLKPGYRF
jgi:hypothetical protein